LGIYYIFGMYDYLLEVLSLVNMVLFVYVYVGRVNINRVCFFGVEGVLPYVSFCVCACVFVYRLESPFYLYLIKFD